MNNERTGEAVLDQEYLAIRAKILEVAASLDRIQRATGSVAKETRLKQLEAGIETLLEDQQGRAERVQLLFSRAYDQHWREAFKISRWTFPVFLPRGILQRVLHRSTHSHGVANYR